MSPETRAQQKVRGHGHGQQEQTFLAAVIQGHTKGHGGKWEISPYLLLPAAERHPLCLLS